MIGTLGRSGQLRAVTRQFGPSCYCLQLSPHAHTVLDYIITRSTYCSHAVPPTADKKANFNLVHARADQAQYQRSIIQTVLKYSMGIYTVEYSIVAIDSARPACRYVDKHFTLPHSIRSIILLRVRSRIRISHRKMAQSKPWDQESATAVLGCHRRDAYFHDLASLEQRYYDRAGRHVGKK
jgi:hypothetical protein